MQGWVMGQSSLLGHREQWVPAGSPRGLQLCSGRNRPGLPRAPSEGAHGAGESQGPSTSTAPTRAFHVLWPPFCLISNGYFYSLQFSVNSPCGGGGGWGSRRNGRGSRIPQEAGVAGEPLCPSKDGLPPTKASLSSARSPSINGQCKTTRVTRPHCL